MHNANKIEYLYILPQLQFVLTFVQDDKMTKSVDTDVTNGQDGCQHQPQARHQCPHRSADAAAEAEVLTNCLRLLGRLHQLLDQGPRR